MRHTTLKQIVLLIGLMLPAAWCGANGTVSIDGYSHIQIKESKVLGAPKGSTINASINGHTLLVSFSENLGQVAVEVATDSGCTLETFWLHTPNGLQCSIPNAGDYVVTFTLPNGDVYYGEFTVTD